MNLNDHFLSNYIIEESSLAIFGKVRFLKETSELYFYDKDFNQILKENIKNFSFDEKSIEDKQITLLHLDKKYIILKDNDSEGKKVFYHLQSVLTKTTEYKSYQIKKINQYLFLL